MPTETELALESSLARFLPGESAGLADPNWPGGPRGAGFNPGAVDPLLAVLGVSAFPRGLASWMNPNTLVKGLVNKFYPRAANVAKKATRTEADERALALRKQQEATKGVAHPYGRSVSDILEQQIKVDPSISGKIISQLSTPYEPVFQPLSTMVQGLGLRGAGGKLALKVAPYTKDITPGAIAAAAAVAAMSGDTPAHVPAKRGVYKPKLEERAGYNVSDALKWHGETVRDPRSSSFERSQSAQTLISNVIDTPWIAPLIAAGKDAKTATEAAIETFLPSAFEGEVSEEFLASTQADIMGDIDWDKAEADEAAWDVDERTVASIDPIDVLPSVDQTRWETLSEEWTDRRKALYEPSTESGMGGILTSDQTAWDNAVAEGNESQIANLGDKHDTRRHLDAVFGTDTAGVSDPRLSRFWGGRQTVADAVVPSIPSDTIRDVLLKSMDNKLRIKGTIATGNTKAVSETLKDLVNNDLFIGARDAGHSAEDAYNNPNTVISSDNFDVLAEALVDGRANIDQLDAALELMGDAAEDNRVVESFTKQGLIDIGTQVESFAGIEPTVKWDRVVRKAEEGFEETATQAGLQAQAETDRRLAKEAREKKAADREAAKIEAAKTREEKKAEAAAIREERRETRLANQAANRKLLAEKKEARDIQKAINADIRAEKLAARESAKQTRIRVAAEKALEVKRKQEKEDRVKELKRHEQMLRFADESRARYLARKKQEDELREAQGYGWGDMFT